MPGIANLKNKGDLMAYDPEKYREKREKVLGIKKRGIGFGTLAVIVSVFLVAGLGAVTVPRAVSYMATRNLEDAIFKLETGASWPKTAISELSAMEGVKQIVQDKNGSRLVVTYDHRKVKTDAVIEGFVRQDLKVTLLNEINHRQHRTTMENEEEDGEAP
jgi:spore coat protein CotH